MHTLITQARIPRKAEKRWGEGTEVYVAEVTEDQVETGEDLILREGMPAFSEMQKLLGNSTALVARSNLADFKRTVAERACGLLHWNFRRSFKPP
jgi:hypothetical protein